MSKQVLKSPNADALLSFGSVKLTTEFTNLRVKKVDGILVPIISNAKDSFTDLYDFNVEDKKNKTTSNTIRRTSALYQKFQDAEEYSAKMPEHRKLMRPFTIKYQGKIKKVIF